ncbi:hypothetical protein [Priestia megaterium]|uniref:hypothetical protein n=1 Tax=Priestia megaterium TaxID=1404 RepID=UPI00203D6175|nr:hypothetical protein [Priestia megaterium]MCM3546930.1 hypothetical protein [Priestia megaterium]
MNKSFYYTTTLTIFLLILFSINIISKETFAILFVPLGVFMLIIGVLELKKTIKNKDDIEKEALLFKNSLKKIK